MRCAKLGTFVALTVSITLASVRPAVADFKSLVARVPGEANSLVLIDIDKIMKSPLAVKEGWKDKLSSAYTDNPLVCPPEASRIVMASLLDPICVQPIWEVSVMDLSTALPLEAIARAERGFMDQFGSTPAAWSPANAYFVQLDQKVLGAVAPANRQFASRWVRNKNTLAGSSLSPYLQAAADAIGSEPDYIFALDLEDVTTEKLVKHRMAAEPMDCLEKMEKDMSAIAKAIAGVRGITLAVSVKDEATGRGTIDFKGDVAALKDIAKPLVLEMLSRNGAQIEDFNDWNCTVKGKTITLEGKLSNAGMRALFSVVDPPSPRCHVESADKSGDKPTGADSEQNKKAVAAASQKYYRSLARIMDNLQKSAGVGAQSSSLSNIAAWMRRDANRINRLPVVNVDDELLAMGAEAATKLSEASQVFSVGGIRTAAQAAQGTYSAYNVGNDADTPSNEYREQARADRLNREAQRRQAAMQEKATAAQQANEILKGLTSKMAATRNTLAKRYGVEF